MGDGILAVFSRLLSANLDDTSCETHALAAVEKAVEDLAGTPQECKGALAAGPLYYCKTGLADIYEDFTVVGAPMTVVYRLEAEAAAKEVFLPRESHAGRSVLREVAEAQNVNRMRQSRMQLPLPSKWNVRFSTIDLKGVGSTRVIIQSL